MASWSILTCEYPPRCGGVGDYSWQIAGALAAAGDDVAVFTPRSEQTGESASDRRSRASQPGVTVTELEDVYGPRSRAALDAWLAGRRSTLLVQYVPTGFGMRGANVPWCRWLERRMARGDEVRVMFHEPYFEFAWTPVHRNVVAAAQRMMARTLMRAAARTYVSTDAWRPYLAPYSPHRDWHFTTLPIPSAIPACESSALVAERRRTLTGSGARRLVGHFGTYGSHIAPLLRAALVPLLLEDPTVAAVCAGTGSHAFASALMTAHPRLAERVHAIGRAPASDVGVVLSACDLLLQPYLDGVTTRRTSVMAGLANARAVLTTTGHLTEPLWAETGAVALEAVGDTGAFVRRARSLLADDQRRLSLASRGERIYRDRFALVHTIAELRGAARGLAA